MPCKNPFSLSEDQGHDALSLDSILSYLYREYQQSVQIGLLCLKRGFMKEYQKASFPSVVVYTHVNQIGYLLGKEEPGSTFIYGLSPKQILQFREEVSLLCPVYQVEAILQNRNPAQLRLRRQGPFYETEAYLRFMEWLQKGQFDFPGAQNLLEKQNGIQNTPIRWQGHNPVSDLMTLFRELGDLVETDSFEIFYAHFTEHDQKPLCWNGPQVLLMYLFDGLKEAGFLPSFTQRGLAETIAEHFLNRRRQAFKPRSLEASYSRLSGLPTGHEQIDGIMEKLRSWAARGEN